VLSGTHHLLEQEISLSLETVFKIFYVKMTLFQPSSLIDPLHFDQFNLLCNGRFKHLKFYLSLFKYLKQVDELLVVVLGVLLQRQMHLLKEF